MDNTTRFRSYPQMATVKKTAEVFGVSASYIRRLCRAGKISFVNTGHVWTAWPGILRQATPARRGWKRQWAVSAG